LRVGGGSRCGSRCAHPEANKPAAQLIAATTPTAGGRLLTAGSSTPITRRDKCRWSLTEGAVELGRGRHPAPGGR
jgi:hypothetical protein